MSPPSCAYHDLTIALNGRMRYTIQDEHITLGEGDAIYCPPRAKISREKESKASYFSINFTTKTNEPLPLNHGMTQLLSHEVNAYIDIISYLLKKPGLHSNEKLENLVKNLLIKVIELQEVNRPMPYVEKIKLYCADNFQKPLTLETVAKYVNLHPSYCSTIFKNCETSAVFFLQRKPAEPKLCGFDYDLKSVGIKFIPLWISCRSELQRSLPLQGRGEQL